MGQEKKEEDFGQKQFSKMLPSYPPGFSYDCIESKSDGGGEAKNKRSEWNS